MPLALALGISLVASLAAWGARALTRGGALAAVLVGCTVLAATGWQGGVILGMFFLPSTLVGRWSSRRPVAADAKGEQRDAAQVLANGGAAALGSALELRLPGAGFWLLTGGLAAAAADTWATAVGTRGRREPRDLLSGARVPRGTSGAVSLMGTLAGVAGGALVAGTAAFVTQDSALFGWGTLLGFAGMLLDSLLGCAVQARYRCPVCAARSERSREHCGGLTVLVGGWRWLDNDGVNALATTTAALAAGGAWRWL